MGKTPKKEKKEKKEKEVEAMEEDAVAPVRTLIPIAKPLADDKLGKKVLKLAKKAAKKKQIKRGVKEVVKAIRKNLKGICILAADISPLDVITHIPVLCEDNAVPYLYVTSKEELGAAGLTKRPTSCMLVMPKPAKGSAEKDEEFDESYKEVHKKVKSMQPVF
ncbi:unnamed protein product [Pedinophyceae sp. YPF-701]|nr:unnamed protein product [Pedinophyceae sp. YPF-701]